MPRESRIRPHEVMFYMALKDGPAYGYQLAGRFRKMTGGHIKLSYGTIYPFLRRMERSGIIRSRKDRKSGRVYYELTRRGVEAERRMLTKMKDSQREVEEKLLGILHMHSEMFGREALKDVLARASKMGV